MEDRGANDAAEAEMMSSTGSSAKRLAVISDVHGNRWALQAVLADIRRRDIDRVFNLGDVFYGPLDPLGTAELITAAAMPTVLGNEDRLIIESSAPRSPTLDLVRSQLNQNHLAWIDCLPELLIEDDIALFHASPGSDTTYLLWSVQAEGTTPSNCAEVAARLERVDQSTVLCGHDHVPNTMIAGDGTLVVDPGSVGLPAYRDDTPHDHVMETRAPHARYAVLTSSEAGWLVEQVAVPYDARSAAAVALENGRPDWAAWLTTGEAGGNPDGAR